jgi:hypothetical protein
VQRWPECFVVSYAHCCTLYVVLCICNTLSLVARFTPPPNLRTLDVCTTAVKEIALSKLTALRQLAIHGSCERVNGLPPQKDLEVALDTMPKQYCATNAWPVATQV